MHALSMSMMAMRNRKIAPESPVAIEEGFGQSGERECGEGCSRESISDDHGHESRSMGKKLWQPATLTSAVPPSNQGTRDTNIERRPQSKRGKRFVRYNNSWMGESTMALNLNSLRPETADNIEEEAEDGNDDDADDAGSAVNDNPEPQDVEPSQALLAYFIWLSKYLEEVNFRLMEQFIADGADINAAMGTGATVMHDVASNWDVNIAEFLFERGANIHVVNNKGQTPLHLAASTDHIEMVRWLLGKGAHLDAVTEIELQTPLHYAARTDSQDALKVLIENGGNYEVSDYKGRTPLHLAAELDRTVAAEYLLSLDPPAECQVVDKIGNHAITSMIRTMPQVAELALDQLHKISAAERKQFFLISDLEPENPQKAKLGIKTPFEMAVELGQYSILSHPVMEELIRQKWTRCVRWSFYTLFVFYILFVLSWSLLIAYPSVQEKHIYIFPRDLWRILLVVIAVGTLIYQVIDEIREVVMSRIKHKAYVKTRSRDLEDDLKHVDPSLPEEKKYLESELISVNRSPPSYFKEPWNIIDIVCYSILFVVILMHSLDVAFHNEVLAIWTARLSCPGIILVWVRLLKYARAFHLIGPLIAIIGHLIGDIVRYFILYGIFLIPYVICFWLMFGGERAAGQPESSDLTKVYRTAIMVFRLSLTDDYPYKTLRNIDELMTFILVVTFLLIAAVIGLNLFIALLSDTFQRVYDNAQANALLQQAQLILSYEEKVCPCIYERYLRHIQNNCNPSSLYYDDDDTKKEPPAELQKITHQIHSIVSEIRSDSTEENRARSSEINSLAEKLARQEENLSAISQCVSEIKTLLSALQSTTAINNSRIPSSWTEEKEVLVSDDNTLAKGKDCNGQYQGSSIIAAPTIPLTTELPQTRKLPPITTTDTERGGGGGGRKGYPYKRLTSAAAILRNTTVSPISFEKCRQRSRSSPSILDYTSGSCSSLMSASGTSHRRVRKMKKAQNKDLKWKQKH